MGTGVTVIGDTIVVPVLVDGVSAAYKFNPSVFVRSGAALQMLDLPLDVEINESIKVPYYGRMPRAAKVQDGQPVTQNRLVMTSESGTVHEYGIGAAQTARSQIGKKTYEEASMQCMESIAEAWDDELLTEALGIEDDYKLDVWSNGAPVNLGHELYLDGVSVLGDEGINQWPVLLAVHSDVAKTMLRQKDASGKHDLVVGEKNEATGLTQLYLNPWRTPIIVSDKMPVVDPGSGQKKKYTSLQLWVDAMAIYGERRPRVATASDIWTDTDGFVMRQKAVIHRYRRRPMRKKPGIVKLIHNAA